MHHLLNTADASIGQPENPEIPPRPLDVADLYDDGAVATDTTQLKRLHVRTSRLRLK